MKMDLKRTYTLLLTALLAGNLLSLSGRAEENREVFLQPDTWIPTAGVTLNDETPEDGTFRFRLLDEEGNLLAEAENEGQSVAFPAYSYAEAGTWIYYLKEVGATDSGIVYDRGVYTAVVEVTGEESLQASVTWQRNGNPYIGIPQFFNHTDAENPKTGDRILAYGIGLALSAAALTDLLLTRRRSRKANGRN